MCKIGIVQQTALAYDVSYDTVLKFYKACGATANNDFYEALERYIEERAEKHNNPKG